MNVLLTGYKGFIGSRILEALKERGDNVILLEKHDIEENYLDKIEEMIRNVEVILHQGAISDTRSNNITEMMNMNFEISKRLFDKGLYWNKKIIFASSASVYGSAGIPSNLYGWSKYCAEQYGLALAKNYRVFNDRKFIALRYFNVYGPGEGHKGEMSSVAERAFGKSVMKLFPGSPRRDFVFIDDVVAANLYAIDNNIETGFYDVGTGEANSFEQVCTHMNVPFEYKDRSEIPKGYQFFTEAKGKHWMSGWTPKFDLKDGLSKYMLYLEQH